MQDLDTVNNQRNSNILPNCKYYSTQDFTASFGSNAKSGLSVIHFNARSLSSSLNLVSNFLTEFNLNFDIIAISETWLNTQIEGDYNIKGYDAYHKVRSELSCKCIQHKFFLAIT